MNRNINANLEGFKYLIVFLSNSFYQSYFVNVIFKSIKSKKNQI